MGEASRLETQKRVTIESECSLLMNHKVLMSKMKSKGVYWQNFLWLRADQAFVLFSPPPDWMRLTYPMEGYFLYSKTTHLFYFLIHIQLANILYISFSCFVQ